MMDGTTDNDDRFVTDDVRDDGSSLGAGLKRGLTLGILVEASKVGKQLAVLQNFSGMNLDQISAALGPAWTECGRAYPKKLGEALLRAGYDPDCDRLRVSTIETIYRFYNPLPIVYRSKKLVVRH